MTATGARSLQQTDRAPAPIDSPHARLLYFVTEDWYFCSHRLPLAIAARDAGFDVGIITRVRDYGAIIRDAGLRLIPFSMQRRGKNPIREWAHVRALTEIYRREQPAIVHHVAMKPVIYGSIAARLAGVPHVINALAGLGYTFTSQDRRARLLRPAIRHALTRLLRATSVIVQNDVDRDFIAGMGIPPTRLHVIRGSGVDLDRFRPQPELPGTPLVILPARLLRDKGVREFADAARRLKKQGVNVRFALVGDPDPENPASLGDADVQDLRRDGSVEIWGHQDDMAAVFAQCHIVCLPSYREGLPKVLLEAAASGRAIVTTDVPGCRDVVQHGENGLLVPVRDGGSLAQAIAMLIQDSVLRDRMGKRGREIAARSFAISQVVKEVLEVYSRVSGIPVGRSFNAS